MTGRERHFSTAKSDKKQNVTTLDLQSAVPNVVLFKVLFLFYFQILLKTVEIQSGLPERLLSQISKFKTAKQVCSWGGLKMTSCKKGEG